jgi:hypothetical protein
MGRSPEDNDSVDYLWSKLTPIHGTSVLHLTALLVTEAAQALRFVSRWS